MRLLPDHLEAVKPLLPMAREVIHVDSESKDGTVEYVRAHIKHANFRSLEHPPGLYQSWNFGIQRSESKYVYVSTVGDTMSANGLGRLHDVMERLEADVLVSVPRFVDCKGHAAKVVWPVHRMITELHLTEPMLVPPGVSFTFAARLMPEGILNSSASNLYRTEVLKARPFPTEFGTAGDTAWGIAHALGVRLGIVPEVFSTFLLHDKTYSLNEYDMDGLVGKMIRLAAATAKQVNFTAAAPWAPRLDTYLETLQTLQSAQNDLEAYRRRFSCGWLFFPAAWKARSIRNRVRKIAARQFSDFFAPSAQPGQRAAQ